MIFWPEVLSRPNMLSFEVSLFQGPPLTPRENDSNERRAGSRLACSRIQVSDSNEGMTEREREELEVNGSEQVKDVFFGLYIAACVRVKSLLSVVSNSLQPHGL